MFKRVSKEVNQDVEVKKPTIGKILNITKKNHEGVFKFVAIIVVIAIVLSSFFIKNKKIGIHAIAEPIYLTKVRFDDLNERRIEREDIDKDFLIKLKDFSLKSSSLVLSKADKNINSLYSPISLYMALSMVAETANGDTQREILQVLNMDNIDMVRSETGKLFRRLYYHNEIGKLSLGNSLWLNKNVKFNDKLLDLLAKEYYASSFSIDYNDKESPKEISQWVSKQTGEKLGNNSDDFYLNSDGIMTLINTVYFYDEWMDRFDVRDTKKDEFYLIDGSTVRSDFMNMTCGNHSYVDAEGYTVSYLNLKNDSKMVFILPDEGVSPYDIASDPELLEEALSLLAQDKWDMGKVIFKIPKFKFSSSLNLEDNCKTLGMENAFKSTADFTNLSNTKPLFISDVKQNSIISIDEKGVETTAYTQIDYEGAAQSDGRAEMILNRPFIFAITGVDGSPLFIGIINNPNID